VASFELRIQTDGQIKPAEALKAACSDIIKDLDALRHNFRREYQLFMLAKEGQGGANGT
jgi:DNA-directed RNA polymerase II subunit RPB11